MSSYGGKKKKGVEGPFRLREASTLAAANVVVANDLAARGAKACAFHIYQTSGSDTMASLPTATAIMRPKGTGLETTVTGNFLGIIVTDPTATSLNNGQVIYVYPDSSNVSGMPSRLIQDGITCRLNNSGGVSMDNVQVDGYIIWE